MKSVFILFSIFFILVTAPTAHSRLEEKDSELKVSCKIVVWNFPAREADPLEFVKTCALSHSEEFESAGECVVAGEGIELAGNFLDGKLDTIRATLGSVTVQAKSNSLNLWDSNSSRDYFVGCKVLK